MYFNMPRKTKKDPEVISEQELPLNPKKKRSGAYSKNKGNRYELKIIKELTELGYDGLKSSRSESKSLDNDKIDIAQDRDAQNELPFYVQCKITKNTPNVQEIIEACPRKNKPLVVVWNKQINKEVNMASAGEFVMLEKSFFYELIKKGAQ